MHSDLLKRRAARLPTAFQRRENVEAGGLMSYGGNIKHQFRWRAPSSPTCLLEQPTKFEFVINLKTARALGLEVPPSIMLRADEVIE